MNIDNSIAQQITKMGFNPSAMHWHSINDPSLLKGDICYYDYVPCKGELKKHGDFMQVNFIITKPTHEHTGSINEVVVLLRKRDEPIPITSKKYENGIYPTKAQLIEHMEQVVKGMEVSKKFRVRASASQNKQKLSARK